MKYNLQKLIKLEKDYNKIRESNKILKDGSHMHLLRKMKKEFQETKNIYLEGKKKIEEIKNKCIKINKSIDLEKEEQKQSEYKLYNECGSNFAMMTKLEEQIEKHKSKITDMENECIALLEKEEKLKTEKEKLRQQLLKVKENFYNYKEDASKNITKAKQDIVNVQKEVAELELEIPQEILEKLNLLRKEKGSAVVEVKKGVCMGCKIKISLITLNKLNNSKEVVCCENCGRIIYLGES